MSDPDRTCGRVLLVSSAAGAYGADRATSLLARLLSQRGWEMTVMVPEPGPLVEELRSGGIPVVIRDPGVVRLVYRPLRWLRFVAVDLPLSVWRVARLARSFDIVHVNTAVVVGAVIGGWMARKPVVLHVRESFREHERVWSSYARILRHLVARVMAVSSEVAEECRRAGFRDVILVHDGVEVAEPPPRLDPAGTPVVVSVGRINSWKGHEVLVDAAAILDRQGRPVRVVIAGDTFPGAEHHLERLREHIARRGMIERVELRGFVEDVPSLLAQASVFVLASTRPEPFGLALVEALAAGVPCVATAHGGPIDIIEHGRSGMLVPPSDAAALAGAIGRLLRDVDLRSAVSAEGLRVVERFTGDRVAGAVEEQYRHLLGPLDRGAP